MASVRLYTLLDEMADDSDSVDNWQTNMLTPGYFANVMSQAAMGVKKLVLACITVFNRSVFNSVTHVFA